MCHPCQYHIEEDLNAHLIGEISGERIRGEFDKILYKHGSTKIAFDLIERSDIDKGLFGQKFEIGK